MICVISFNLTQDNCVRFLRGIALYKAVLKNNFTVERTEDLRNIKSISSCISWYLVEFCTISDFTFFKERYPEFNYIEQENTYDN